MSADESRSLDESLSPLELGGAGGFRGEATGELEEKIMEYITVTIQS